MAGKPSPNPPRQPAMRQKRTGQTGTAKGDPPGRGKNAKADVNEHTRARAGQQTPPKPTAPGANTPYPQTSRTRTTAPQRDSRAGVRDQASKGGSGSLFERMDQRNAKLSARNRKSA